MRTRIPRGRCLVLVLSSLALAGLWNVRERGVLIGGPPDGSLPALRAEKRRLQTFTTEHLAKLEKERSAAQDAWRSRVTTLPATWVEGPREGDPRTMRRLRCLDPAQLSWSQLVAFVGSLEERNPGKVVSIDVRSRGTRRQRAIAAVDLILRENLRPGLPDSFPSPLQR